ncbi:MAG: hypothetical protein GXP55_25015, partial [Deltaproteobacteria bacterium]|nr:hypothetical protein [Deltaproteobacteria bacterium]
GDICLDSSTDTSPPPPADGGMDTSTPGDSGMDTGPGPSCRGVGGACDPTRGCSTGGCLAQRDTTIGGPTDPIDNGPDGGISFPSTVWAGGYCSPNFDGTRFMPSCDVNNADDPICGDCATCVNGGGTPPTGICLASCTASITDNGTCRDGYDCNLSVEACFPGCGSDDECKTTRQNTNGIDGIQTPSDCTGDATRPAAMQKCGGDAMNFDHLVYDAASTATCDPETFRCNNPGTAGAQGGDTCTNDSMCEANGRCLDESSFSDWVGGSCVKFRCDLAGNECAGDAVCQDRRIGVFLCLAGCTVGDGATAADKAAWLTNRGGCREGYACTWNGVGGAGTANNGACVPGNFNDVTTNNIGAACTENTDCWSPFGQGLCLKPADDGTGFRGGYCTMLDCLAPGTPDLGLQLHQPRRLRQRHHGLLAELHHARRLPPAVRLRRRGRRSGHPRWPVHAELRH